MGFIDEDGLKHIKEHKYVSGNSTPLDNAMQPFWNASALLIPKKVAPNLVTLSALMIMTSTGLLIVYND